MKNTIKLKYPVIVLNILLIIMCIGFFTSHGLPKSYILWISAVLWLITPITSLVYILQISKQK